MFSKIQFVIIIIMVSGFSKTPDGEGVDKRQL